MTNKSYIDQLDQIYKDFEEERDEIMNKDEILK